jgi:hypothetical protein
MSIGHGQVIWLVDIMCQTTMHEIIHSRHRGVARISYNDSSQTPAVLELGKPHMHSWRRRQIKTVQLIESTRKLLITLAVVSILLNFY